MKNNNENDEIVLGLFSKVRQKQKEIEAASKPNWKTHCSFGYDSGPSNRINIQVEKNASVLVKVYAWLSLSSKTFLEAAKDLGLKAKFDWMGFGLDDWADDIKAQISRLQIQEKKEELKKLEDRVDALVTTEQRRSMEIEELRKLI